MGSDLSPAVTAEEQRRVSYASLPLPADTTVNSIASQSMNLSLIAQDTSFANSVEDVAAPSLLSLDDIAGGVVENVADPEAQAREAAKEEADNAAESEEETPDDVYDEDDASDFIPDEDEDDEEDVDQEDGGVPLEMIENELSLDPEDIEEGDDVLETDDAEAEPTAPIPLDSDEKEANRKRFSKRVMDIIDVLFNIGISAAYDPENAQSFSDLDKNYKKEFLVKAVINSVPDEVQVLFGAKKIGGTEYLARHMPKIPKECGGVYCILAHREQQNPLDEDPIKAV
ncbi:hypothetical protein FQN52_006895 [Onygenales sp. PD_12]|nr:hypothetical protein FQN52_006895 [Onygenales sp. PD_12]